MIETTPSYRCKVQQGNMKATLRLGRRSFKVQVVEMSRDTFSVRVPANVGSKVTVGSKSKLFYQDMLWSVLCTQKWIGESGELDIEFQQLEELTPLTISKTSYWTTSKQVRTIGDGTLPVTLIGAFILVILIMPAWGGEWGTSDAICNAVNSTCSALGQLITGKR